MISFKESDWDKFCNQLTAGQDPRSAIKWITPRATDEDGGCEHERTREISIANGGKKVFCVKCDQQVA